MLSCELFVEVLYNRRQHHQKATLEIAPLKRASNETLVPFAHVLRINVGRCRNPYSEGRTKVMFNDRLPVNFQSPVRMLCSLDQDTHHLKIAQYAATLLQQVMQASKPAKVAPYKTRTIKNTESNVREHRKTPAETRSFLKKRLVIQVRTPKGVHSLMVCSTVMFA